MPIQEAHPTLSKRRVLLIGWDAADWIVLNQLMDAGRMPHLSRFVEAGVIGNLASLQPCLSPMLWTSAATGKTADKHGILGFVEPRSDGLGVIPSQSTSRRSKAIWNLLEEAGHRSCVVAWPVSDPPEPLRGVYISERMTDNLADRPEDIAPVPQGCIHPATLEPFVSELRLHPCELALDDLRSMIPGIANIDLTQDSRPEHLARLFARCASVHAVATAAMEAEPWDFFAVYYDTIDRACHDFMAYRAPQMPCISTQDHQLYGSVVDGIYEFHDAMLGRLVELAGEDTTVILMSDHGYQSGSLRPTTHSSPGIVAAEGADSHRMLGVFAIKGPGIKRDQRIYGATLLDITPTLLSLFGLPIGRDMDGRVMTGAFVEMPEIHYVDSWETSEQRPSPIKMEPLDLEVREASIRQLVALGYLSEDAVEGVEAARIAERENLFNLATVHLHHGRSALALPIFEDLCDQMPLLPRYELSRLHTLSRLARHDEVLEHMARLEDTGYLSAQLDLLAAAAYNGKGFREEALARLNQAAEREPANPYIYQVAGDYHLSRQHLAAAEACYAQAIALDAEQAQAHSGMAQVALDQKDFERAANHALLSLRQAFYNPLAQFRLGRALEGLGALTEARRAFEHAVEQSPRFSEAHYRLAALFEMEGDHLCASVHRQKALGFDVIYAPQ